MSKKTVEDKVRNRLQRSKREVFLREDFNDLGGYTQVGRVLKKLVEQETILRLGYGIYAKAEPGILSGEPVPRIDIKALTSEVLGRFGIETALSKAEQDYNAGKTTQVPTGRVVGIKGKPFKRRIGYNGAIFRFERV